MMPLPAVITYSSYSYIRYGELSCNSFLCTIKILKPLQEFMNGSVMRCLYVPSHLPQKNSGLAPACDMVAMFKTMLYMHMFIAQLYRYMAL